LASTARIGIAQISWHGHIIDATLNGLQRSHNQAARVTAPARGHMAGIERHHKWHLGGRIRRGAIAIDAGRRSRS